MQYLAMFWLWLSSLGISQHSGQAFVQYGAVGIVVPIASTDEAM